MRVLQLIDSLDTGGAERVAVNLANGLSQRINGSFLCATRKEGLLKESLSRDVKYLFLNKQQTIDTRAIKVLNKFIKSNNINIIHAHSSSFFLATIIKMFNNKVSIIWHDHYGDSEFLKNRKYRVLSICSKNFSHIVSVNKHLESWAKKKLKTKEVTYLPNYTTFSKNLSVTKLEGLEGKRVVCLANLRPQKDHFTLISAFKNVVTLYPDWTLHCIGKDFNDKYAENVKLKIENLGLQKSIFVYGGKADVFNILDQCEVGVLSSKSEGLPIALLEYGLAKLAVVATKVGECGNVVINKQNGLIINPIDSDALSRALILYLEDKDLRKLYSTRFKMHIQKKFSEVSHLDRILNIYKNSATT